MEHAWLEDGLDQDVVHARGEGSLLEGVLHVGSDADDDGLLEASLAGEVADDPRALRAVEVRHAEVE